ncbi:hypothetical protein VKT23_008135 [Stygiomarasmius scandens]|uniref:F-box domain-containing protein n=1 Tax=Marasmiellus scandens TaxID=2682957 RepID=A0ABR1JJW7_9AGAR
MIPNKQLHEVFSALERELGRLRRVVLGLFHQRQLLLEMGEEGRVDLDDSFGIEICDKCHAVFPELTLSRASAQSPQEETFSDRTSAVLIENKRVMSVFRDLQEASGHLKPFAEEYQAIVGLQSLKCSVYELPLEILTEIFAFLTESCAIGEHTERDAPRVLSQVCSHWRNVLHSTPKLWSKILLGKHNRVYEPHSIAKALNRANLHLEYSGNAPLRIFANFRATQDYGEPLRLLFVALGAHAHRWQNLEFRLNPGDFNQIPFPKTLPRLARLTCEVFGPGQIPSLPRFDAPHLRYMYLCGFSLYGDTSGSSLQLGTRQESIRISNLERLTLKSVPLREVISFLRRASSVEYLVLANLRHGRGTVPVMPEFTMTSCKCIRIQVTDDFNKEVNALFGSAKFPKLKVLELASLRQAKKTISIAEIPLLIPMLLRSNYEYLRAFSLIRVIATDTELLGILTELPSLTDLTIDERLPPSFTRSERKEHLRIFTRHFLYRISGLGGVGKLLGDRVLLRKLTWLRLVFRNRKLEERELVSMLKSRFMVESDSRLVLDADGMPMTGMTNLRRASLSIPKKRITHWFRRKLAILQGNM